MKILFVEDLMEKQIEVVEYLRQIKSNLVIKCAKSIMSGIIELSKENYDTVLLDMSLFLYDPGVNDDDNEFVPFGGTDILDEIERRELHCKIIVLTSYDVIEDDTRRKTILQLDYDIREEYSVNYVGCIHYDQTSLEWKSMLNDFIGDGFNENINSR